MALSIAWIASSACAVTVRLSASSTDQAADVSTAAAVAGVDSPSSASSASAVAAEAATASGPAIGETPPTISRTGVTSSAGTNEADTSTCAVLSVVTTHSSSSAR